MTLDLAPFPTREVGLDELPRNARGLAQLGLGQGFAVRCVHVDLADGYSDSVRLARGDERYYGVWLDGKFDNAGAPWQPMNLTQLRARVAA